MTASKLNCQISIQVDEHSASVPNSLPEKTAGNKTIVGIPRIIIHADKPSIFECAERFSTIVVPLAVAVDRHSITPATSEG